MLIRNKDRALEKFVKKFTTDYVYTPLELCDDMVSHVKDPSARVLVIRNIEFVRALERAGHDMSNVWFATDNEDFKQIAIKMGVDPKQIDRLEVYKLMKFDYVIMNPPYNPKAVWKNFVEMGMDLVKDNGKMIIIHPATWRESTKYKKLADKIKNGISELHINDYNYFKAETKGLRTDWYVWQKGYDGVQNVTYSNGEQCILDIKNTEWLLRISEDSIPAKILKKITSQSHNGLIVKKGFDPLYKEHNNYGKYKQCGIEGNGTGWTIGNFGLTEQSSEHQYKNKVVMSYVGPLRAQYFNGSDEVGVLLGNYWLTDNKSLPILINSKLIWKLLLLLFDPDGKKQRWTAGPIIFFQSLNFKDLNVKTEEELYQHYKLTNEEIKWIQN